MRRDATPADPSFAETCPAARFRQQLCSTPAASGRATSRSPTAAHAREYDTGDIVNDSTSSGTLSSAFRAWSAAVLNCDRSTSAATDAAIRGSYYERASLGDEARVLFRA